MNKIVVVIPAKKKSRRLKNKNILPIQGIPMFYMWPTKLVNLNILMK